MASVFRKRQKESRIMTSVSWDEKVGEDLPPSNIERMGNALHHD